jgi:hypothetical protein
MAEFRKTVGREFFGGTDLKPDQIEALSDDLLFLQGCVNFQRVWSWASPLVDPQQYERKARDVTWREANRPEYSRRLQRLRDMAGAGGRIRTSNATAAGMTKIAEFIVARWAGKTP